MGEEKNLLKRAIFLKIFIILVAIALFQTQIKIAGFFILVAVCYFYNQFRSKKRIMIYEGIIYDVTTLFNDKSHPGGEKTLIPFYGKDVSSALDTFHTESAKKLLRTCPIVGKVRGVLEDQVFVLHSEGITEKEVQMLHDSFKLWISEMCCVAAKIAINKKTYGFFISDKSLGTREAVQEHLAAIKSFKSTQTALWKNNFYFTPMVALFPKTKVRDSQEYERLLFQHLQFMLDFDPEDVQPRPGHHSERVDPQTPHFDFSALGRRYFVAGLSPIADRNARKFDAFGMVLNGSEQFEWLKSSGQMGDYQKAVRKRDRAYSGSVNPNILKHEKEEQAEGRQYSGVDHSQDDEFKVPLEVRPKSGREDTILTYSTMDNMLKKFKKM